MRSPGNSAGEQGGWKAQLDAIARSIFLPFAGKAGRQSLAFAVGGNLKATRAYRRDSIATLLLADRQIEFKVVRIAQRWVTRIRALTTRAGN